MPKKTLLKLNTYCRYIDINTKYCYLSDKYAFAYLSDRLVLCLKLWPHRRRFKDKINR